MTGTEPHSINRGSMTRLLTRIAVSHGVDLVQYREAYLERRIAARMRARGVETFRRYGDIIDEDPMEMERLLDAISINVTDFFRDKVVWTSIRQDVLGEVIERKKATKSRTIRAWSAGCATGEEPYSLAMMILDMLGADAGDHQVSVLATDVDPKALAIARKGRYPKARQRTIPSDYRLRFTSTSDDSEFEVLPEVRKIVRFHEESLFVAPPARCMDLILCRNVFIYLGKEQQARVIEGFWHALAQGGYLVLGRSEKMSVEASKIFEAINGRERVYRKPLKK